MSETTTLAPPNLPVEPVQGLLFRYAQDLQEMLAQHRRLLHRHQKLLQLLGRGEQGVDLLLNTTLHLVRSYMVTNAKGEVLHASHAIANTLRSTSAACGAQSLHALVAPGQEEAVHEVLQQLTQEDATLAMQYRRLVLSVPGADADKHCFDVLAMRGGHCDRLEVYWLFNPCSAVDELTALDAVKAFPFWGMGEQAMMMTDDSANICAVNLAFNAITGYRDAEVMGENPRMLGTQVESTAFFEMFWEQLQEKGGWSGELFNRRKGGQLYFEWLSVKAVHNAAGEIVGYVAGFSDLSQRADVSAEISPLAFHDPLTGLPNRRLLEARLTQLKTEAKRIGAGVGVLHVSIELGQHANDAAVLELSRRLQAAVHPGDVVARVGSDEFVVLLKGADSEEAVAGTLRFLLYSLDAPIHQGPDALHPRISVGVSRFPGDGADRATLLARAQSSMVNARQHPNRYCFWSV